MIEVVDAGFFSSVQDGGRPGYRKWGVPVSGAMDRASAVLANKLLGNPRGDGVLEITLKGPGLRFHRTAYFCLTGAKISAQLEDRELEMNTPYRAREGDLLKMGPCLKGVRSYFAVQGGIQTESVMGSRSLYVPVTTKACIQTGDNLPIAPDPDFLPAVWAVRLSESPGNGGLEVLPGPEWEKMPTSLQKELCSRTFSIAKENNRMAYQLEERLHSPAWPMITSVTIPGTVQLTSSGRLIVLMRDAQTTGGYPRVLQLTEDSINVLAQKSTGERFRFVLLKNGVQSLT